MGGGGKKIFDSPFRLNQNQALPFAGKSLEVCVTLFLADVGTLVGRNYSQSGLADVVNLCILAGLPS